jgi:hypothetical protein
MSFAGVNGKSSRASALERERNWEKRKRKYGYNKELEGTGIIKLRNRRLPAWVRQRALFLGAG